MASFDFNSINAALTESSENTGGVDFTGKSLKLDSSNDAQPIIEALNQCKHLHYLTLTGNTLGVDAAKAIAKALESHPEFKQAKWSDMFTGRMKTEIPLALTALGDGMIVAKARLTVLDLSDNAFGPIGVQGLAKLLQSEVCSQLQELRLNNNGLGITGGKLLATALSSGFKPKLKVFIAGRNRLENDGATALAAVFKSMGTLEEIAMPQNGIYHVGVTALSEAFKSNTGLRILNLNDNTVGYKGAEAIARSLSVLKNLRHVNFGDCLLKSRGSLALANAFRDNSIALETVDLSHNEIGRSACMEIVECLTHTSHKKDSLTKVVLSGNSLGGDGPKKQMKDKLGDDVAVLSEGDDSDEEFLTGSEEDSNSEDSDTEDAQQTKSFNDTSNVSGEFLDDTGVDEVAVTVDQFLENPSLKNIQGLGSNAASVIDAHLQSIKNPDEQILAYVEATLKVSGLVPQDERLLDVAMSMYDLLIQKVGEKHAMQWVLTNHMLVGLGLIKSETKNYDIKWHLPGCYDVLKKAMIKDTFPKNLSETIKFFAQSKKEVMSSKYGVNMNGII